jgi:hypothetical protein
MDPIRKFKNITVEDTYKGLDKSYASTKVAFGAGGSTEDEALLWNYVERVDFTSSWADLSNDMINLFHSFGIAREDEEDWFRVFNIADQWNAQRMIIASIPQSGCGSYIDGSTVKLNVPYGTGATEYTTFYGSTFKSYPDPITGQQLALEYEDMNLGGASCMLFGNTNSGTGDLPAGTFQGEQPYSGTVNGNINPNSGELSFDPSTTTMTAHLSATHWRAGDDAHDFQQGIAILDKGIFVIFDMPFVGRQFIKDSGLSGDTTVWTDYGSAWSASTTTGGTLEPNVSTANRSKIYFAGTNGVNSAKLSYRTIEEGYKFIYFCHAGQNEFNSTSNHTYNSKQAYFKPEDAGSLWVTEIGLYDNDDTLLAYAKLSEPVEKNKLETLTFKVELEL